MRSVQLLRVFTDKEGNFGDLASVVIDEGKQIPDSDRQAIAHKLNTGETIFINDIPTAKISVIHPQGEIGFAGVGVLGVAWFLSKLHGKSISSMQSRDGEILTWQEDDVVWSRARLDILPPWNFKQLSTVDPVEQISLDETNEIKHTLFWSWIDESKGFIRARTFAADWDIPEAQGNGSGAMKLAANLKRSIEIKHGNGSVIFAKPAPQNSADIGGRVIKESIISVKRDTK